MISVIKATGEQEPFSEEKILHSIQRAKIPKELEQQVLSHVKTKLYDSVPTSELYRHIIEFLDKSDSNIKARYGLKQAIMDLGPTGYPFEDFVAEILKAKGYATSVRAIVQGACIQHEIDVIAQKESPPQEETTIVEAKFHNSPGIRTDIHVALYTKARFDDIKKRHGFGNVWLITNTKVTGDVITYALCVGMKVTSWSYPEKESLRDLIQESGLHPITALTTLFQAQKQQLLDNHIVLCKNICDNIAVIDQLGISDSEKQKIYKEAQFVCNLK